MNKLSLCSMVAGASMLLATPLLYKASQSEYELAKELTKKNNLELIHHREDTYVQVPTNATAVQRESANYVTNHLLNSHNYGAGLCGLGLLGFGVLAYGYSTRNDLSRSQRARIDKKEGFELRNL
jgi:hypothetical protein